LLGSRTSADTGTRGSAAAAAAAATR
jgi:hypothetical protein